MYSFGLSPFSEGIGSSGDVITNVHNELFGKEPNSIKGSV